jgi:hypothetical protein
MQLLSLCLWGFVERFRESRIRAKGDKHKQARNGAVCGCSEPNGLTRDEITDADGKSLRV